MKNKVTTSIALSSALAFGSVAGADANPFGFTELKQGYETSQIAEGSCGGDKDKEKAKDKKKDKEGKCGEGKCGEGKCGGEKHDEKDKDKAKDEEGKCGEGKCGEGKCGAA